MSRFRVGSEEQANADGASPPLPRFRNNVAEVLLSFSRRLPAEPVDVVTIPLFAEAAKERERIR